MDPYLHDPRDDGSWMPDEWQLELGDEGHYDDVMEG